MTRKAKREQERSGETARGILSLCNADVFDTFGDYVYGYYRGDAMRPFYVGKGQGVRAKNHWQQALREVVRANGKELPHINQSRLMLSNNSPPIIKLLAYNLETTTPDEVYSVVERTLQNTFGIQKVWDARVGAERLENAFGSLLQIRDDARYHPILSLEAAYCRAVINDIDRTIAHPSMISEAEDVPVLLVGLSKTYHPSYSQNELSEMARRWWNLELPRLKSHFEKLQSSADAILAAWCSRNGHPQIVGAWRIQKGSFQVRPRDKKERTPIGKRRVSCVITDDIELLRRWLGFSIYVKGKAIQGPQIYFPIRGAK